VNRVAVPHPALSGILNAMRYPAYKGALGILPHVAEVRKDGA